MRKSEVQLLYTSVGLHTTCQSGTRGAQPVDRGQKVSSGHNEEEEQERLF